MLIIFLYFTVNFSDFIVNIIIFYFNSNADEVIINLNKVKEILKPDSLQPFINFTTIKFHWT